MKFGGWKAMAAVLAGVLVLAGTARAEGLKIAVIDVNKILNESDAGVAAKKKMEERYKELKTKIDAVQEEARTMKEDLDKQKILLAKEKLKEKEEALAAKVAELRRLTQESEKEMQTRQADLTRDVLKMIEAEVDKVVAREKIDLLLERSAGVIHFNPALDITSKVKDLVDKDNGKARTGKEGAGGK
ncbi:MAG: OmpH family outer membrane protein [Deltaproteobacteria bacterium]|nr:OmpH family outer membrane protein [Deltaproteobacteria bacterium]